MVILFPTGLYKSVLPVLPADPGNIIFTISNSPPPRAFATFLPIPSGISHRTHADKLYIDRIRRRALGNLVMVSKIAGPTKAASGNRTFSLGQVLEFTDQVPTATTADIVGDTVETTHNLHYINPSEVGLNDTDAVSMTGAAVEAQRSLLNQLAQLQAQRKSLEVEVSNLQKAINDTQRVIAGVDVVLVITTSVSMIQIRVKLQAEIDGFKQSLLSKSDDLNILPDKIAAVRDQLMAVAELIK